MAFAAKYKGTGQVTMCFFGEAAVNQGIFHESLNMAQLWKLPLHLHLRKQPVRHGHFARTGDEYHAVLRKRLTHTE